MRDAARVAAKKAGLGGDKDTPEQTGGGKAKGTRRRTESHRRPSTVGVAREKRRPRRDETHGISFVEGYVYWAQVCVLGPGSRWAWARDP